MASSASTTVAASATAAILAAAERCQLAVPQEPVPGAVAPPMKPKEAVHWIRLAANAFKTAGWKLEAGWLLLGMGPDAGEGSFWRQARKWLHECPDKAAVAAVYEQAARQELWLEDSSGDKEDAGTAMLEAGTEAEAEAEGGGAVVPKGFGGGFLSASRLLHDALKLQLQEKRFDECRRLLAEYEGLQPLLRRKEVDEITLVRAVLLTLLGEIFSCSAFEATYGGQWCVLSSSPTACVHGEDVFTYTCGHISRSFRSGNDVRPGRTSEASSI